MTALRSQLVGAATWMVLFLATACSATAAKTLDISYVPDDTIAAFVVHPHQIFTAPQLEMLPLELITNIAKEGFGITPANVEEAVCVVGKTGLSEGSPGIGVILKFIKPYNPHALADRLGGATIGGVEEIEIQGKECLSFEAFNGATLYLHMINPSTLLVATAGQFERMLLAKQADSPFRDKLEKIDTARSAVALVDRAAIEPLIQAAMQSESIPAEWTSAIKLFEFAKFVELRIDVKEKVSIDLLLEAPNAQQANSLKKRLDEVKAGVLANFDATIGSAFGGPGGDPAPRSAIEYARRMLKKSLVETSITLQKETVVVSTSRTVADIMTTGALVAVLVPIVQDARQQLEAAQSAWQLKVIGLAMHIYHDVHKTFPASSIRDKQGKPLLSWRVAILPYIQDKQFHDGALQALYKEFHLDEPWDSEHNRKLIAKMPPIYARKPGAKKTNFLGVVGKGTALTDMKGVAIENITDGTDNTILVVESDDDYAVEWTRPDDLELDPKHPLDGLGHLRNGFFKALMADGSVRRIDRTIDPDVLRGLTTYAGGEKLAAP